ncbi:type VI secretion system baseplate subunit TssF [Sutterella sp.]|uniref:type VI secretion system baseplate subunit TssF n=1 Tax=Sutterella sp. TaxID=1981025 RepID=UPI0026DF97F8|nr:type VI secretion system baseplate subunit TssF [Sutterella sp.]MDO5532390.1 type VI secretion system baseplate subunit TssF [Sutterella sp.]
MDKAFLDYYRENLAHLRESSGEFAAEFPKIAARLELTAENCQDPFVERLLEGTAFLAARVEKRLDDGYPRLLESILTAASPMSLTPEASGAVLELTPEMSSDFVRSGTAELPVGSRFRAMTPVSRTPVIFSTQLAAPLLPVALSGARYILRGLEPFAPKRPSDASALVLSLGVLGGPGAMAPLGTAPLRLFLGLPAEESSNLMRLMLSDVESVWVRRASGDEPWTCIEGVSVRHPVFDDPSATLFNDRRGSLHGLQVLRGVLEHPDFLRFIDIRGLFGAATAALGTGVQDFEAAFVLRRRDPGLVHAQLSSGVRLNCVPALNLFAKRSERMPVGDRYEFHVVASRTSPVDYEVRSVEKVDIFSRGNHHLLSANRFYDARMTENFAPTHTFFSVHRRERLTFPKNAGRVKGNYRPHEVWIALSGRGWNAVRDQVHDAAADITCTNADLPLFLRADQRLEAEDAPGVAAAYFASAPTRPQPPLIARGAAGDWEKLSHLFMNLSTVLWQPGTRPLEMIRRLVRQYSSLPEEETERLTSGITGFEAEPKVFRFIRRGCVFFENGWEVRASLDAERFAGTGAWLFGLALRSLVRSLTPINTTVEFVLLEEDGTEYGRWTMPES